MTVRDSKWKYIVHGNMVLRDIGILADGTLFNPNEYDAATVRTAVLAAIEEWKARRSEAAKKAAITRRRRIEAMTYTVASRLIAGGHTGGPSHKCNICGKGLSDIPSIERGIGSKCWQGVMLVIEQKQQMPLPLVEEMQ
jgi:Family of unknown function (DUF6011)